MLIQLITIIDDAEYTKNGLKLNTKTIKYLKKLFPLSRSITGKYNRKTLKILSEIIPIKIKFFKSGTKVYDS